MYLSGGSVKDSFLLKMIQHYNYISCVLFIVKMRCWLASTEWQHGIHQKKKNQKLARQKSENDTQKAVAYGAKLSALVLSK